MSDCIEDLLASERFCTDQQFRKDRPPEFRIVAAGGKREWQEASDTAKLYRRLPDPTDPPLRAVPEVNRRDLLQRGYHVRPRSWSMMFKREHRHSKTGIRCANRP
jgi:hypothetical protein